MQLHRSGCLQQGRIQQQHLGRMWLCDFFAKKQSTLPPSRRSPSDRSGGVSFGCSSRGNCQSGKNTTQKTRNQAAAAHARAASAHSARAGIGSSCRQKRHSWTGEKQMPPFPPSPRPTPTISTTSSPEQGTFVQGAAQGRADSQQFLSQGIGGEDRRQQKPRVTAAPWMMPTALCSIAACSFQSPLSRA